MCQDNYPCACKENCDLPCPPHPEHHGQKAEMQRVEKGKEISVGGGKKNNGKESLEKEVWTLTSHMPGRKCAHTHTHRQGICTQITAVRKRIERNSRKPKPSKCSLQALLTAYNKPKGPTSICSGAGETTSPWSTHGSGSAWRSIVPHAVFWNLMQMWSSDENHVRIKTPPATVVPFSQMNFILKTSFTSQSTKAWKYL